MNTLLSDDHLLEDYPEEITAQIRSGHATCLRYNFKGDHLASGRLNGTVVVWDLDTMGVAVKLRGHANVVSSLSWSTCDRYLLSACQGLMAILWDLQDGSQLRQVRFNAPVYIAELSPVNHLQFVASLFEDQPYLVDMSCDPVAAHALPSVPQRTNYDSLTAAAAEKQTKEDGKNMTTATIFSPDGEYILAGTSKGRVNMIDARTRELIYSDKACGSYAITTMRIAGSGRKILLVNCQDRIIRTFRLPDLVRASLDPDTLRLEPEHRFSDVVNRMSWNHTTFSATGEYVIASTYTNHELYLWERGMVGSLVRMLVGPKEELGMIDWHPARPSFAVLGLETGTIYIWSNTSPQKWSALAPGFGEVEENVEYMEREDEFDTYPQADIHKQRLDAEDEVVDIVVDPYRDAAATAGFRVPILFDVGDTDSEEELVEVSTGTMRRKSPGEDGLDEDELDENGFLNHNGNGNGSGSGNGNNNNPNSNGRSSGSGHSNSRAGAGPAPGPNGRKASTTKSRAKRR